MDLARRRFLQVAAGASALAAGARSVRSDDYPARPVHLIIGFPGGSPGDTLLRLMGQWLQERLGQPFVVENRPGAGGNIGTESVAKSPPDGYRLLLVLAANAINASVYKNLNFDFAHDIAPVAGVSRNPLVMEVTPTIPARTVPEFIAYAKANPGKLNMASAGNGTVQHVAGEMFKMMTGVDMRHVPYRGSPQALTDLLSGEVQVMFDIVASSIGHIKAGRLRALAVTTAARTEALPDVPPLREFVAGYEASGWAGIGAPRDTPAEIVERLNDEINAGLADAAMKARLAGLGVSVFPTSPAEFGRFIAAETEKWAKVAKFARIEPV
jgi:tripartite-type tricarboxylate transporter receptor subunit TctC